MLWVAYMVAQPTMPCKSENKKKNFAVGIMSAERQSGGGLTLLGYIMTVLENLSAPKREKEELSLKQMTMTKTLTTTLISMT